MTVYIEPVSSDFWQLAKRDDGSYIDPLGPKDCMTHSASRLVHRALEGKATTQPITGYNIRRHCINDDGSVDTSGGVNHSQIVRAVQLLYGVTLTAYYANSFDDMIDLCDDTRGIGASLWYQPIRDTASRRGSFTFYQNHEIFLSSVDRKAGVFRDVVDPLADGRQSGLYKGPGPYTFALIKDAMGKLNVASSGYRALGFGKAYFIVTAPTGTPPLATTPHYRALVRRATSVYNPRTSKWVYRDASAIQPGVTLDVRGRRFYFASGGVQVACYAISKTLGPAGAPDLANYFIPCDRVTLEARIS